MSGRYFRFVTEHPIAVLLLALLVLAATAAGIPRLSFKSDLRIYFSPENPQILSLDRMEQTYTKVDNVLFVLAPADGVFNNRVLALVQELTTNAWQIPFSSRVDSITNYKHSYAEGDDIVVDDLVLDAGSLNPEQLAAIRAIALDDPLLRNRAISPDGKVTGINVTINIPKGKELSSVPVVVAHVRALADDIRARYPDIDLYLSGVVMMDNAFAESSERDMQTLVPAMLVLALTLMGLIMGSLSASLVALLVLTLSIVAAMGLAGWLGILLNPVSINAPNIILTIAICDCVHLLAGYLLARRNGENKKTAMQHSLQSNLKPVLITSVTTGIGFLCLNTSEAPPFRDLGNITALGVLTALFFSLTLLPALMMLLRTKVTATGSSRLQSWLDQLAVAITRHPARFALGSLLLAAGLSAGIVKNSLNDEFVKYFDDSIEFRQHTDFTTEHLTGIYYIDYAIASPADGGVNDPDYLQTLDDFTQWLRAQGEVLHVNSITDIYRRLNRNMHGDDPAFARLPQSRELAAQYLLMYEMSLPYGLDLRDRINGSKDASRVTATLKTLSSAEVLAFDGRVQEWLQAHGENIQFSEGTGLTIMFAHIGMRNITSMLTGTAIALVVISLLLVLIFRSFKYGLLSLLPNLLPALVAFGIWGLLVGQVGMALSVVAALTLGIVVDDTVHIISRYLHARRLLGYDARAAVRYTFARVGKALVITSIALAGGFAVLGFSSFEINAGMGSLTALAIALALLLDLTLLPAVLVLVDRGRERSTDSTEEPAAVSTPATIPASTAASTPTTGEPIGAITS
ncbi:MMPL family transporter [Pseudomaricurvus alcaniphilus]|uniref:efflux RND transporter permease subunit n=1 Tax=Pseudomaricurvus alcaniphilus TaxID=1166482 RepID=UPI00140E44E4|nr:MMPL family transporter [Pseudomaricurvus alcaniphilus]NHN38211.1 MMPL family transporter [Pseudomaricurvus alcaniphilus]